MFDVLNQAMFYMLDSLKTVTGSYGLAIIAVTILIRAVLWPMNTAQTRSMKKMQELQPKLKEIQEKYKDNPPKLQESMMKLYAEHKFNPFSGCLPMIIQLPIFIALYGALNSPEFLAKSGNENFLFVDKLYHTLQSHGGEHNDGDFHVDPEDKFRTGSTLTLFLNNGKTLERKLSNPTGVLDVRPRPMMPGEPVTFAIKFSELGLSDDYTQRVVSAEVPVIDEQSHELEILKFKPNGTLLQTAVDTHKSKLSFNMDVLILIGIYALMTLLYQKLMESQMPASAKPNDPQAQMMKFLPLTFIGLLFFIPIPAGVMIYLIMTTLLMNVQSFWLNYEDKKNNASGSSLPSGKKPTSQIVEIKPDRA